MADSPPEELRLRTVARVLEVRYADGSKYELPFEYLRVFSPSAEVQGHGGVGARLVTGKQDVGIRDIEPVGQYAVRLIFDDGHDTGLYTWNYLRELGERRAQNWAGYLQRVERARSGSDGPTSSG